MFHVKQGPWGIITQGSYRLTTRTKYGKLASKLYENIYIIWTNGGYIMAKVVFSLTDAEGRTTRLGLNLETAGTDTVTELLAEIASQAALLGAITELTVQGASLLLPATFEPIAGSGDAADNIDRGATFRVLATGLGDNPDYRLAQKIPGINFALQDGQGNIDITDTAVVAYFAEFLDAGAWRVNGANPTSIVEVQRATLDK